MTDWKQLLSNAGCRITTPRRAVMQVLMSSDAPLSPQKIRERAQAMHHELGLVTVYRTLKLLTELNLVRRIHTEEGCHGYVAVALGEACHHLVCTSCRRTVEFPCTGLDDTVAELERLTGFSVQNHWLELLGLCPACQAKQKVVIQRKEEC